MIIVKGGQQETESIETVSQHICGYFVIQYVRTLGLVIAIWTFQLNWIKKFMWNMKGPGGKRQENSSTRLREGEI